MRHLKANRMNKHVKPQSKHFVIVTWKAFFCAFFQTFLEGSRENSLRSGRANILSTRCTESCRTLSDKFVSTKQARCQSEVLLVADTRIFAWQSIGLDACIVREFCKNISNWLVFLAILFKFMPTHHVVTPGQWEIDCCFRNNSSVWNSMTLFQKDDNSLVHPLQSS